MLRASELTYQYNSDQIISFPSIEMEDGDALLILGPSGCGKSTLLHLLGGLLHPKSGSTTLGSTDYSQLKGTKLDKFRGDNIGIVFQQHHFIRSLNMLENLDMAAYLAGKTVRKEEIQAIASQVNVNDLLHKRSYELSIGQQQRMAIARALVNQPKLILADEPTSSLDNENSERVADLLIESANNSGAHLIIVTHDHRLADRFKNKIEL